MAAICAILLGAFAGNQAHAQSFGINFLGNASDPVTGLAGVLPIGNWNNISNTTFTSGSILSSDGLSSATLSLSGSGSANGWHSGTVSDVRNGSLLDGYMDTGTTSTGIAAISGLTGSLYNIFIYDEGDAARPGNGGDWLPNYTINGITYYTATLTGAFTGFLQGGVTTVNNNTFPTSLVYDMIANWAVNAVAMMQATPMNEPGFVNCTYKLNGIIIGTSGSWNNHGNTVAKVFDGNLNTFFDGPDASGDWVGLDFGVGLSNTIGQINYWPHTGYSQWMLGGMFQGDNISTFPNPVTIYTIISAPPEGGVVTSQTVTNAQAFRYVRYVGPSNGSCNVAELQFFSPNAPSASPQITNIWDGTRLTISWPNGGTLLEATNVTGPWTTNSSTVTPFVVLPAQPQKYFRVLIQESALGHFAY